MADNLEKIQLGHGSGGLMMQDLLENLFFKVYGKCEDDAIFAATAVTDGELLKGVQYKGEYCLTHSVVMRAKSGTVRFVEGRHSLEKKPTYEK